MTTPPPRAASFRYKAFISYSHAADGQLAPALQSALQRFLKPWYRRRAMRIFRDQTGLAVTPELWSSIRSELEQSEFFILLASPKAAESAWVGQEVEHWLQHRSADSLLIVCTEGEIAWSAAERDFDWSKTNALPRCLERAFQEEPLFADLRWAQANTELSLRRPRFLEEVAKLTAMLRHCSPDDVYAEDLTQHQKTMRVFAATIAVLLLLVVVALGAAYVSLQAKRTADRIAAEKVVELLRQRKIAEQDRLRREDSDRAAAEKQRRESIANQWAKRAAALLLEDRELSTLVAVAAVKLEPTPAAEHALRQSLAENVPLLVLRGHTALVGHVQFSPDGQRVLTSSTDGTVRLWDTATGTNVYSVTPAGKVSGDAAAFGTFDDDGRRLLTLKLVADNAPWLGGTDVAEVRDAGTGQILNTISNRSIFRSALSPDGRRLVTLDRSSVGVWDTASGIKLFDLTGHTFAVVSAMFSTNGQWIATGSWDGTARIWEAATGRILAELQAPTNVNEVAFTPDGMRLLTVSDGFKDLRLWDWARSPGRSLHAFAGHNASISDAVFSRDGRWFITGSMDGTTRLWETATGQCPQVLGGHEGPVTGVDISPNGRWIVTAGLDRTVRLWDATTGEEMFQLGWNHFSRTCVAFSSDGQHIVTGTSSGDVALYRCEVCGSAQDLVDLANRRGVRVLTPAERAKYLE